MKYIDEFRKENGKKAKDIVFLGIINEDEKLYEEYAVEVIPTMYFINEESDVTGFIQGAITKEKLEEKI